MKRKQWVEVNACRQDCEIPTVFLPVFPSQALWPSPQENTNLMDSNERLALPCRHDKGRYIYFGAKALLLPSLVLEQSV